MRYLDFKNTYEKNPIIRLNSKNYQIDDSETKIIQTLKHIKKGVICFETYPGVDLQVLKENLLDKLKPQKIINIESYAKDENEINRMLDYHLTDDRVFGKYSLHQIEDFYHKVNLQQINQMINKEELTIIYGFGATLIEYDYLIMVGLTRWEIQLRYRKGATNFKVNNLDEDVLRKYKRGYFVEWRVADRIKDKHMENANYMIDYTDLNHPKMITQETYGYILDQLVNRPFRMVPYFDPGVWGGQWMKEACNLDPKKENYAWSFDGVPEENSIKIQIGQSVIELPAQDVVQFRPRLLMGDRVHARFGKHFPIRFDLLDTFEGGNLSLQVHPKTEYIQEKFGMTYTQDESYYILDAKDDAVVYLGFKENIDKEAFKNDLIVANKGEKKLDEKKYINILPAKKHDHFLIPAGTIHCSGRNTMVLEISACVYIFTFKLWDWGRLGLDGLPRPVHLEHGFENLDFSRDTKFVKNELVNQISKVSDQIEKTGLHEREFLNTFRYNFKETIDLDTNGSVHMGNLVDGKRMTIESLKGEFDSYGINYAETFIIPANVKKVRFKCMDENGCIVITANVRA